MAAIETLASPAPYDAGFQGTCDVMWWAPTYDISSRTPVCALDSGPIATPCTQRFDCPSDPAYGHCREAWINMTTNSCQVTVISVTGQRSSFQVAKASEPIHSRCSFDCCGDDCGPPWDEDVLIYPGLPENVTLTFGPSDGGASVDVSLDQGL